MGEWRPVAGYESAYEVSNDGRVRRIGGGELGQWLNADGYALVRVSQPRRVLRVHRLVAEAFIPNPEALPFVNHLNNKRDDNRAVNLEWCTQAENLRHAARQGRMQRDYWTGRRSPNASLSNADVRTLRSLYASGSHSHSQLAQRFGISKRAVGRCLNKETYQDV